MEKLEIYCITNKRVNFLENSNYNLAWVGKEARPNNYIRCDNQKNIFYKEQHYSELTFQYWYWKNLLDLNNKNWIGFCQKRRFWIKNDVAIEHINKDNILNHLLFEPQEEWKNFESIICKPISVSGVKKMKLIKRGWKNLIKDPTIIFNNQKKNIALHFDMQHGYGNLDIAIDQLQEEDKKDFKNFVNDNSLFNPHIMFIAKTEIANAWFKNLFAWLERCEKKFGFDSLKNYDTKRLYAFLAERYLSFWFKKYTKHKEQSWIQMENF